MDERTSAEIVQIFQEHSAQLSFGLLFSAFSCLITPPEGIEVRENIENSINLEKKSYFLIFGYAGNDFWVISIIWNFGNYFAFSKIVLDFWMFRTEFDICFLFGPRFLIIQS